MRTGGRECFTHCGDGCCCEKRFPMFGPGASRTNRLGETLAERRIRERDEFAARVRRITDAGGIAGISGPEGFF